MTTRADIATKALSFNGYNDGTGYPGPYNMFEEVLGRPQEFWCGDFVSAIFKMCNLPLPIMQLGMETGFASVPLGYEYAQAHGAAVASWQAQVADIVVFANAGVQLAHVELVTSIVNSSLLTVGGDSGSSNIDPYRGEGGVHRHETYVTPGVGSPGIAGVISTGRLVKFSDQPPPPLEAPMLIEVTSQPSGQFTVGSWWEYGVGSTGRVLYHVADPKQVPTLKAFYGTFHSITGLRLAADVAALSINTVFAN